MEYIFSKQEFLSIKESFKKAEIKSAHDYIIYNVIRGVASDKGFTPLTNPIKLANGAQSNYNYPSIGNARWSLKHRPEYIRKIFGDLLTDEKCALILEAIK